MNADEIVKALRLCGETTDCVVERIGCPYYENTDDCKDELLFDAADLIEAQLELQELAKAKADGRMVVLPETGIGDLSDGYHTFNELYHHRAILFSVICNEHPDISWKSKLHHDGTMFDGMFIVGINTPEGQATYHYDINPYWDMFRVRELEKAPEWDGHTSEQAIERIAGLSREAAEKAIAEAKRAAEESFAEAFCDFAESNANRDFERQMREGWEE